MSKIYCPCCGDSLTVPEKFLGMAGNCKKCSGRFETPSLEEVVMGFCEGIPVDEDERTHISAREDSDIDVLVDTRIAGYDLVVVRKDDETVTAFSEPPQHSCRMARFFVNYRAVLPDDVLKFTNWFIRQPIGLQFLEEDRYNENSYIMAMWQRMNGSTDSDGNLLEPMPSQGFTKKNRACGKDTRDPSGLCATHRNSSKTTWATEWEYFDLADLTPESRKELNREVRARKWADVAASINCTATNPQVCLLLDLGISAADLEGISKAQASELIDQTLNG